MSKKFSATFKKIIFELFDWILIDLELPRTINFAELTGICLTGYTSSKFQIFVDGISR